MSVPLQFELHTVESIKSTNTALKSLAKDGAPEGYVLCALQQTAGRGRMNRVFFSPKGTGLYVSILLRPKAPLSPAALTCLSAVAVFDTIRSFDLPCGIKWVNDLYMRGKKVCGILVEGAVKQNGELSYAVAGIGVNLFKPSGGFPEAIADKADTVFSCEPDDELRRQFLKRLLLHFKHYYDQLPALTFSETYRNNQLCLGKTVLFSAEGGMHRGTAVSIDDAFRLVVDADGTRYALDRGDVILLD